jgi:futalosine hydrolase
MIVVVAATEIEMVPFQTGCAGVETLVTGMGPVEASVILTRFLADHRGRFEAVINLGVAGAYLDSGLELLDICLANDEVLGDLGICHLDSIELFDPEKLPLTNFIKMDGDLLQQAGKALAGLGEKYTAGRFVTVSCATATAERGAMLREKYAAICENMEGAAVARGCREFDIPCLEIRCISNMVEDRNVVNWRLEEACKKVGDVTAKLVSILKEEK